MCTNVYIFLELFPSFWSLNLNPNLKFKSQFEDYNVEIFSLFDISVVERKHLSTNFGNLQMARIGKAEEVFSAGFPDFRIPKLMEHVDWLATCPFIWSLRDTEKSKANVEYLCENTEEIKKEVKSWKRFGSQTVESEMIWPSQMFSERQVLRTTCSSISWKDMWATLLRHSCLGLTQRVSYVSGSREKKELSMYKLIYLGGLCFRLSFILMQLQDVEVSEFPEIEYHLHLARGALSTFNFLFRNGNLEREVEEWLQK